MLTTHQIQRKLLLFLTSCIASYESLVKECAFLRSNLCLLSYGLLQTVLSHRRAATHYLTLTNAILRAGHEPQFLFLLEVNEQRLEIITI